VTIPTCAPQRENPRALLRADFGILRNAAPDGCGGNVRGAHMVKVTKEREIALFASVRPGDDGRRRLELPDDLFGRKPGIRLGRKIVWGHDARYRLAEHEGAGWPMRGYGRAPMPRPALVGNNRKLRYLGHGASDNRPRARYAAMSTPVGGRCRATFDPCGRSTMAAAGSRPQAAGLESVRPIHSGRQSPMRNCASENDGSCCWMHHLNAKIHLVARPGSYAAATLNKPGRCRAPFPAQRPAIDTRRSRCRKSRQSG
jgi:hypothetical protein